MIVYNKLAEHLKQNGKKLIDLQNEMKISRTIIAKFQKNRNVNTETIDKICTYLHVQPGDIMEWVENEDELEKQEIKTQMKALQERLKELESKGGKS